MQYYIIHSLVQLDEICLVRLKVEWLPRLLGLADRENIIKITVALILYYLRLLDAGKNKRSAVYTSGRARNT